MGRGPCPGRGTRIMQKNCLGGVVVQVRATWSEVDMYRWKWRYDYLPFEECRWSTVVFAGLLPVVALVF